MEKKHIARRKRKIESYLKMSYGNYNTTEGFN